MPRRNLDGGWGLSHVLTVRLGRREQESLVALRAAGGGTDAAIVRAALNEAAARQRTKPPVPGDGA